MGIHPSVLIHARPYPTDTRLFFLASARKGLPQDWLASNPFIMPLRITLNPRLSCSRARSQVCSTVPSSKSREKIRQCPPLVQADLLHQSASHPRLYTLDLPLPRCAEPRDFLTFPGLWSTRDACVNSCHWRHTAISTRNKFKIQYLVFKCQSPDYKDPQHFRR